MSNNPRILILDIETSPALALVWKFWQENVSPKQVIEHPYIMSFAAKWLGDDEIIYHENRHGDEKQLLERLVYYLDLADVVVAHNGGKFDLPKIRGQAAIHGIAPPSPVKLVDTYRVAKKEFNFPSNSLEYLTTVFGCNTKKTDHDKFPGFKLWLECLRQNDEAWSVLKVYNIDDILSLEELYLHMRPWITDHPNLSIYVEREGDTTVRCPKCNSSNIQWRGYAYTTTSKYHRFQCKVCGGWSRSRYQLNKKNENLVVNAVS